MPVIFSESAAFNSSCATALSISFVIIFIVVVIIIVIVVVVVVIIVIVFVFVVIIVVPSLLSSSSWSAISSPKTTHYYHCINTKNYSTNITMSCIIGNTTHSMSSRSSFRENRSCCMYSEIELKYLIKSIQRLNWNTWSNFFVYLCIGWFVCCFDLCIDLFVCSFDSHLIALPMSLEPLFRSIAFSRIWRSLIL